MPTLVVFQHFPGVLVYVSLFEHSLLYSIILYAYVFTLCCIVSYCMPMYLFTIRGRCGHDRIVVGFITSYAISAYHH